MLNNDCENRKIWVPSFCYGDDAIYLFSLKKQSASFTRGNGACSVVCSSFTKEELCIPPCHKVQSDSPLVMWVNTLGNETVMHTYFPVFFYGKIMVFSHWPE